MTVTRNQYEQAKNIDDLARIYRDETAFSGTLDTEDAYDEFYDMVKQDWWELVRDAVEDETTELPGYRFGLDKSVLDVRGVVHGVEYLLPPPDDGIEMLNQEIAEKKEYGPVLYEQGLGSMIDDGLVEHDSLVELDDISWAHRQDLPGSLQYTAKRLAKLPVALVMTKLVSTINRFSDDHRWDHEEALVNGLDSVSTWDDVLNAADAHYPPLHLSDEYGQVTEPTHNLFLNGRSVYQGFQAAEHLDGNDHVSLYVGINHVPAIRDLYTLDQAQNLTPLAYQHR